MYFSSLFIEHYLEWCQIGICRSFFSAIRLEGEDLCCLCNFNISSFIINVKDGIIFVGKIMLTFLRMTWNICQATNKSAVVSSFCKIRFLFSSIWANAPKCESHLLRVIQWWCKFTTHWRQHAWLSRSLGEMQDFRNATYSYNQNFQSISTYKMIKPKYL